VTNKQLYYMQFRHEYVNHHIHFRHNYLDDRNFFPRLGRLLLADPPTNGLNKTIEALDRDWVASALHREKLLAYKPSPVYVAKIACWRHRKKNVLALMLS
jgi:hypothetical protein